MARSSKPAVRGLEKHGNKWRWRTSFEGRRLTFPLSATTEDEAVIEVLQLRKNPTIYELGAWTAEANAYIAQGRATGKLSEKNAANRLSAILSAGRAMGVNSPRQVTPAMLAEWLAAEIKRLPEKSTSPGAYLAHLRAFFKHLVLHGRLSADPTAKIEAPVYSKKLRDVFIPAEDLMGLFAAAKAAGDRDMEWILALGCECGMRRAEISAARREWFDLRNGTVTVPVLDGRFERKGKVGRKRSATVPLSAVVLEIISRHGVPEPYVIAPTVDWGKAKAGYRFDFRKRIRKFLSDRGFGHVTIHDLRRSFGSNRVSAGVSIEKVANWMGINPKTAWRHYTRFIPADEEINRGSAMKPTPPPEPPAKPDKRAALEEVKGLLEEGLITPEEAAEQRRAILSGGFQSELPSGTPPA